MQSIANGEATLAGQTTDLSGTDVVHGTEVVYKCDGTYSSPGTTEFTRTCQNGNFVPSLTTDEISCLSG